MNITDRLYSSKWGIFNHYLDYIQNSAGHPNNTRRTRTTWNECVHDLDVKKLAEQIRISGAHYYFITMVQGNATLLAPNKTFDEIAGTRPGEACSTRDVVIELAEELDKIGVDLYLYFTGDGPYQHPAIGPKFGLTRKEGPMKYATPAFVEKWSAVFEEYTIRYGNAVKGWWIDGCMQKTVGYTHELLAPYARAVKRGNPNAVFSMNNGLGSDFTKYYPYEDFVAGESNDFDRIPRRRFEDGAQTFLLAPLGISPDYDWNAWGRPGCKHDSDYMHNFISCVNQNGGVVTIDVALKRDGSFDSEQLAVLKNIRI